METVSFDFDSFEFNESNKESSVKLQRSEQWYKDRSGNFTGSRIDDLMKSGTSTSKMSWLDTNKVFDFGSPAEKYIFEVGKERETGLRSQNVTSSQMYHGIINEPLLIQRLLDDGVIDSFKECDYMPHKEVRNLGASPDGLVTKDLNDLALECKCTVSWDGFFKRRYSVVDDKHCDWWQFQTEMLVLGVKKLMYVVAYPMTIEKYDVIIVDASPIHQEAIKTRVKIANRAIDLWKEYSYKEALSIAISEFK